MLDSTPARQHKEDEVPAVIEELTQRLSILHPQEGFVNAASVELEDVLLCCGAKSGTTWLQHIVHGLRSGGSMEFEEISSVFPGVEFASKEGFPDLDLPQSRPYVFKTHLPFDMAPKTSGKRIILTRNPMDAAVSLYYFYGNWLFELDDLSLDDFVEWMVIRDRPLDSPLVNTFQMRHLGEWFSSAVTRLIMEGRSFVLSVEER